MKKLIIILLFLIPIFSFSQERDKWYLNDTLASGTDSIKVDTLESKYLYSILTLTAIDTLTGSLSTNDSVIVEWYEPSLNVWTPINLRYMSNWIDYERAVLATAESKSYFLLHPAIWIMRVRLINADNTYRKVHTSLLCKTY